MIKGKRKQWIALSAAFMMTMACTGQTAYAKESFSLGNLKAGSEKVMEQTDSDSSTDEKAGTVEVVRAGAADVLDREETDTEPAEETVVADGPKEDAGEEEQISEPVEEETPLDSEGALARDYPELVMANVSNSVNVRLEADEGSELIGKLYKDCAASMMEQKNGFTKVHSGKLEGWVKDEYLLYGEDAKSLAREVGRLSATVETETLRIRKEADENSGVYGLLARGEDVEAIEELGDWVKVQCEGGKEGFISSQYVSVEFNLDEGETIDEIKAREAAEQEAREKAEKETAEQKQKASRTTVTTKTNAGAVAAATDDLTLLAALIQSEAGSECYEGQLAVGAVVVNRARGRYGSIAGAIYAPGQFGPAASGKVAAVVAVGPNPVAVAAAQEALSGVTNVGGATHFRNIRSGYSGIVIGNHVFW